MEKTACWICGSENTATKKTHSEHEQGEPFVVVDAKRQERWRHYCPNCREAETERLRITREVFNRAKKQLMFERALQILEGQRVDMYELRESINAVEDFTERSPDSFDSAYEMLAAIILISNRVHCKPQQKVGKYQVDFLLPDELVVLEIDGERHAHRRGADSVRDKEIRRTLGPEWEVVRISTDYLDQNARQLVTAIRKICELRIFGNATMPPAETP